MRLHIVLARATLTATTLMPRIVEALATARGQNGQTMLAKLRTARRLLGEVDTQIGNAEAVLEAERRRDAAT